MNFVELQEFDILKLANFLHQLAKSKFDILFFMTTKGRTIYLLTYVNDIIIIDNNLIEIKNSLIN